MKRNYLSTTAIATFGLMAAAPQSNADIIFAGSNFGATEFYSMDTRTGYVSSFFSSGAVYGFSNTGPRSLTVLKGNSISNLSFTHNRITGEVTIDNTENVALPSNMLAFTGGAAYNNSNGHTYITRTSTSINPSIPRQIATVNCATGAVSTVSTLDSGIGSGFAFSNGNYYATNHNIGAIVMSASADFSAGSTTMAAPYPSGVTSLSALDAEAGALYTLKSNGSVLKYQNGQWNTLPHSFPAFSGTSFGLEVIPTSRIISFPHLAIAGPPNPAPGSLVVLGLAGILASRRQRTA